MGLMTLFQLLSVPIFLKYWGVELYGEWLALNTLTAYFQMTDIGLNTATGNSFTFNYVRGQYDKCTILINNNIFFIFLAFTVILGLVIILGLSGVFVKLFRFSYIDSSLVNVSLILLFLQVMLGTFNNLLNTLYTATNNYARGIMIDNFIRLSEYTTLIIGVVSQISILYVLLLGVIVKLFGLISKFIDSYRFYKLSLGIRYLRKAELKEIFLPAVSFFSFPVANSLTFQGVTLLINFYLGSISVVLFNTTRTLVNFCKSIVDILHKSIWPEISVIYGKNDLLKLRQVHYRTVAYSILLVACTSIFLYFSGEYIYTIWTKNVVEFNIILFTLLLMALITNTLWSSSSVLLQATNNHKSFSLVYLLSAVLVFVLIFLILRTSHTISYIPISMIIADLLLIFFVLKKTFIITNDKFSSFLLGTYVLVIETMKSFMNKTKRYSK